MFSIPFENYYSSLIGSNVLWLLSVYILILFLSSCFIFSLSFLSSHWDERKRSHFFYSIRFCVPKRMCNISQWVCVISFLIVHHARALLIWREKNKIYPYSIQSERKHIENEQNYIFKIRNILCHHINTNWSKSKRKKNFSRKKNKNRNVSMWIYVRSFHKHFYLIGRIFMTSRINEMIILRLWFTKSVNNIATVKTTTAKNNKHRQRRRKKK